MLIEVIVKTRSKKESVELNSDGVYLVKVNALPVKGAANEKVQEALANYFSLPKSLIILVRGSKSSRKVFEIKNHE